MFRERKLRRGRGRFCLLEAELEQRGWGRVGGGLRVRGPEELEILLVIQVDSYHKMRRHFSYPGIRQNKLLGRFP